MGRAWTQHRAWEAAKVEAANEGRTPEPVPPVAFKPKDFNDLWDRFEAFQTLFGYPAHLVVTGTWETEEGQTVDMAQTPATLIGNELHALPQGNLTTTIHLSFVDLKGRGKAAQRVEIHAIAEGVTR